MKIIGIVILLVHLIFIFDLAYLIYLAFDTVCIKKSVVMAHVIIGIIVVVYHFGVWYTTK